MKSNEYVFVDQFLAPTDVETAWHYISDIANYPNWWGNVYKKVQHLYDTPTEGVGAQWAVTVAGFLPYTLTIENRVQHIDKFREIRFQAWGDLQGHGIWHFEAVEGGTQITFDWRVQADAWFLRLLSPILKPLFRKNHEYCVRQAEIGMRRDLQQAGRLQPA